MRVAPEKIKFSLLSEDLENWMSKLPSRLSKLPLIYLAIPGSHDTFTYSISKTSTLSPDAEKWLQNIKRFVPTTYIARWSKTQGLDIATQLASGVRFFDLRVATNDQGNIYFVHGLYSCEVDGALQSLNEFLNTHPKEVVILDCQHFYQMNGESHYKFQEILRLIFGHKIALFNRTPINSFTLESLWSKKQQVLVIYRQEKFRPNAFFPSAMFPTPWPNQTNGKQLIEILSANLTRRNYSIGYVSQFVLTPDVLSVVKHLAGSVLSFSAKPLYKEHLDWVRGQKAGIHGVNVIIGDYIDYKSGEFPRAVIDLNEKIEESELEELTSGVIRETKEREVEQIENSDTK